MRTLGTSSSAELPEISTSAGSLVKTTWVLTLLRPASPRAVLVKKVVLLGSLASGASAFSPRLQILVKVADAVQAELVTIGSTLAVITGAFRLAVAVDLEAVRQGPVVTWEVTVQVVQNGVAVIGSAISRMRTGT